MSTASLKKKSRQPMVNLSYPNKFKVGQLVTDQDRSFVGEVLPSSQYSPVSQMMVYHLAIQGDGDEWRYVEEQLEPITPWQFFLHRNTSGPGWMIGYNSAWRFVAVLVGCFFVIYQAYAGGYFGARPLLVAAFAALPFAYLYATWLNYKSIWK